MNTIQRNFLVELLNSLMLMGGSWAALHFSGFPPKAAFRFGIAVTVILLLGILRLFAFYWVQSRLRRGIEEKDWAPELKVSPKPLIDPRMITFLVGFVVIMLLTRFI